jgi:hypothetical protein
MDLVLKIGYTKSIGNIYSKEKHHDGLVTLFKTVPERGLLNQLESLIKRKVSYCYIIVYLI